MSTSHTFSETTSFTLTHAKHMAAKVATDLKRMQRLYGSPSDLSIAQYEGEVVELLKAGYLGEISYGFRKDGNFIPPTLRYTAQDLANSAANDDDPGKVPAGADITGATFYSFLTYSSKYLALTEAQQAVFEGTLPLKRGSASAPGINGYMMDDRRYSAGGVALGRASLRPY